MKNEFLDLFSFIMFIFLVIFVLVSTAAFWGNSTSDSDIIHSKILTINGKTYQCKPVIIKNVIIEEQK